MLLALYLQRAPYSYTLCILIQYIFNTTKIIFHENYGPSAYARKYAVLSIIDTMIST